MTRDEVKEKIAGMMMDIVGCERTKVTNDGKFMDQLGMDSLDAVELVMAIESEFNIEVTDPEAEALHTLDALTDHVTGKLVSA